MSESFLAGQVVLENHPKLGASIPCLRLRAGKYNGTLAGFAGVNMKEDADGKVLVSYDVEFIENPHNLVVGGDGVDTYFGEIITYIMLAGCMAPRDFAESDWSTYTLE
jgi:hypothetical protein